MIPPPRLPPILTGCLVRNNVTGDVCLLLKVHKIWYGDDEGAGAEYEIRYSVLHPDEGVVNSSAGYWDSIAI